MQKKNVISIDLDKLIEETKSNIEDDRASAHSLLTHIMTEIFKDSASHKEFGFVAAKYLEAMSRSSEQLIKLLSTLTSKTNTTSEGGGGHISSNDKDDILDQLQEEYNEDIDLKTEEKKEEEKK